MDGHLARFTTPTECEIYRGQDSDIIPIDEVPFGKINQYLTRKNSEIPNDHVRTLWYLKGDGDVWPGTIIREVDVSMVLHSRHLDEREKTGRWFEVEFAPDTKGNAFENGFYPECDIAINVVQGYDSLREAKEAKEAKTTPTRKRKERDDRKDRKSKRFQTERYNDIDDPRKAKDREAVLRMFEDVRCHADLCLLEGPECRALKIIRDWKTLPNRIDIPNCVEATCDKIEAFVRRDQLLRDRVFVHRMTDSEFFKQNPDRCYHGIWDDRCSSVIATDSNFYDLLEDIIDREHLHGGGILAITFCQRNSGGNVGGENDTTKNRVLAMMAQILAKKTGVYKYVTYGPETSSYKPGMCSMRWKMLKVHASVLE